MRAAAVIGGHVFLSKKEAKRHYGMIRDSGGPQNTRQEAFLMDCVMAHEKVRMWVSANDGLIDRVYVGRGAKHYQSHSICVDLKSRDCSVKHTETVGPDNCLAGLFGVKSHQSSTAVAERYWKRKRADVAREAVRSQSLEYREKHRGLDGRITCRLCCQRFACVVVDHAAPLFAEILESFIKDHPNSLLSLDDPAVAAWKEYHKHQFCPQVLCFACHSAKTAAETSARAKRARAS
jgi:hypothetical protein